MVERDRKNEPPDISGPEAGDQFRNLLAVVVTILVRPAPLREYRLAPLVPDVSIEAECDDAELRIVQLSVVLFADLGEDGATNLPLELRLALTLTIARPRASMIAAIRTA